MPISSPSGYTDGIMNPTQLGPYEIRSRLGRGGMGAVYEAVDTTTGDVVAVKVLASHLADDPGLRSRFDAEIDILKNLRHPGIVRLLAFGEQEDQPFFAMELVRGKSLEQLLRSGRRFTWRETLAVAIEITRALKVAHDQGVVHRDLKPANLLVAEPTPGADEPLSGMAGVPGTDTAGVRAERITVKLADFGIAKLFGGVSHTALGHVVGTAEYMAPEQASGRPADHRVDLYALGLVMYAMMTGSPPFRGTQLTEVIDKQRRAIPPRVATLVPDVPAELDELIARLLSKDPAQRPANALALGRLLAAIGTVHPPAQAQATAAGQPRSPSGAQPSPARGAAVPQTAHERSNKPTRPVDAIGQAGSASPPGQPPARRHIINEIDLLAPTQDLAPPVAPPPPPGKGQPKQPPGAVPIGRAPRPTAGSTAITQDLTGRSAVPRTAASASPAAPSRLPTDVASATTQVDRSQRNQFTTVAEFERVAAEKASREQRWQLVWQGLTATVIAIPLAGIVWFFMQAPSADQLHDRIVAVADDEHGDLRDVRKEMDDFLATYADDPRAGRIRDLKRTLDLDVLERRARRRSRSDKGLTPLERDYRAAMNNEEKGPSACVKALEAMLAVHGSDATTASPSEGDAAAEASLWLALARRKIEQLRPQAITEQQDDAKRIGELLAEAASLANRADIANDEAARKKLATQRRAILENIVELYAERPHAAEAVGFATRELADQSSPRASGTPGTN